MTDVVLPAALSDALVDGLPSASLREESIGARLENLEGWGWHAVPSVQVGRRANDVIDYLLVGPGGVFAIDLKDHSSSKVFVSDSVIIVDGKETHHLMNARYKGEQATGVLTRETPWTVPVTPVLVLVSDTYVVKRLPEDVLVLRLCDVPNRFKGLPRIFSEEYADWIYDTANTPATWH